MFGAQGGTVLRQRSCKSLSLSFLPTNGGKEGNIESATGSSLILTYSSLNKESCPGQAGNFLFYLLKEIGTHPKQEKDDQIKLIFHVHICFDKQRTSFCNSKGRKVDGRTQGSNSSEGTNGPAGRRDGKGA